MVRTRFPLRRRTRAAPPWGAALGAVALPALLWACAAGRGAPPDAFPDFAARNAGREARLAFEALHEEVPHAALVEAVAGIGGEVLEAFEAPGGGTNAPADPWRIRLLDTPDPLAVLFADRNLAISRGALAELGSLSALEGLFRRAGRLYSRGGFRSGFGGALRDQPLSLLRSPEGADPPLPPEPEATSRRERWLDLLDGLGYGEPPEFGAALGGVLLFPRADLRVVLGEGDWWEFQERGRFRGVGTGGPTGFEVREFPSGDTGFPDGDDLASEAVFLRRLAARITASAASAARTAPFVEAFRIRGFRGVKAPLVPRGGSGSGRPGSGNGSPPASPGTPAALVALVPARDRLVELRLECGERPFTACESEFVEILETADRLFETPIPGPLRLAAVPVSRAGTARRILDELAASGASAVSLPRLHRLNRTWLDEELAPGDRVVLVVREPFAAAEDEASGRGR